MVSGPRATISDTHTITALPLRRTRTRTHAHTHTHTCARLSDRRVHHCYRYRHHPSVGASNGMVVCDLHCVTRNVTKDAVLRRPKVRVIVIVAVVPVVIPEFLFATEQRQEFGNHL